MNAASDTTAPIKVATPTVLDIAQAVERLEGSICDAVNMADVASFFAGDFPPAEDGMVTIDRASLDRLAYAVYQFEQKAKTVYDEWLAVNAMGSSVRRAAL